MQTGCARNSSYWAIDGAEDDRRPEIPDSVPQRIAVMVFSGHELMVRYAAEKVSVGMRQLGFDIVSRQQIEEVMGMSAQTAQEEFDPVTRKKLLSQLGLEGLVVGRIIGKVGVSRVVTMLEVGILDIDTGDPVWVGRYSDDSFSFSAPDPAKSVDKCVKKVLGMLEDDLDDLLKQQKKETKRKAKEEAKAAKAAAKAAEAERKAATEAQPTPQP